MSKIGGFFSAEIVDAGQFCAGKMVSKRFHRVKFEEGVVAEINYKNHAQHKLNNPRNFDLTIFLVSKPIFCSTEIAISQSGLFRIA